MTYVLAFGLVFVGICFGVFIEHMLKSIANNELASRCYRQEVEIKRLKRGLH